MNNDPWSTQVAQSLASRDQMAPVIEMRLRRQF